VLEQPSWSRWAERFHEREDRWLAEGSGAERLRLFAELEAVGEWLGVDTNSIFIKFIKRMPLDC
jgi:hypothetical protein